jgi:RNA polymerase-interacting CarD/CdnL/TRCF family regulator
VLRTKLQGGDVLEVTEAVRDMSWRREQKGQLTLEGKRLYDKGMSLLAAEIASVLGSDIGSAEVEISRKLRECMG